MCRRVQAIALLFLLTYMMSMLVIVHGVATASGNVVGYITVKENSTGIYVSVPEFDTLFNVTYSKYFFATLVVNSTCILLRSYYINGTPLVSTVKIYGIVNSTLIPIATVLVSGASIYCNSTLSNLKQIAVTYSTGEVEIGPVVVVKPTPAVAITVPTLLRPYVGLILAALAGGVALSLSLRRISVGLVTAGAALYFLLDYLEVSPVYRFFPILLIFLGIVLILVLEKNPEQ